MHAKDSDDLLGVTQIGKINDHNVHTMQWLISCFQSRVTPWATSKPRTAPPSPARTAITTKGPAIQPKTTSSPMPKTKLTSAPSLGHILVTTTLMIICTLDIPIESTTHSVSIAAPLQPCGNSAAWNTSTACRTTTQLVVRSMILSFQVLEVLGDAWSPGFDPVPIDSNGKTLHIFCYG